MFPSSDLARMRGPAPPAGSAVLRGPVGPAMSLGTLPLSDSESAEPVMPTRIQYSSSVELLGPLGPVETLLLGVDWPGLCQIVLTIGLLPGVAVPLPVVSDPCGSLAVRGGWSSLDVAGTSAVVARVGMDALLMNIGAPSDRAVECPAWDGGCQRDMVDDWTIYELTIYELMMVVVYMFCAYVLLCIFCSQGFSRFASLSGVIPRMSVWGIVRSFLGFEHVRGGGGVV